MEFYRKLNILNKKQKVAKFIKKKIGIKVSQTMKSRVEKI